MNILFIHQGFPGQFKHLAPALVEQGHAVSSLTLAAKERTDWRGVTLIPYALARGTSGDIHPWVRDYESKVIRGEAAFRQALLMKKQGYSPDVIIAHPGWGESLFLKEVWPDARLGLYCEFYYHTRDHDVGFDPEFPAKDQADVGRVLLKNTNNLLHMEIADAGISPTHWQAATFPERFCQKITVVHDGIDTDTITPNPAIQMKLNNQVELTCESEVITFVNRNLEPYRGYHIFMRALPKLLASRPNARVLIVGGDEVSYGAPPQGNKSWRQIFIDEVRPCIEDKDWARVHFLGRVPYKTFLGILQLSTVHVYLTYPFVLSWSLLEAMAAGCAIVASDTQPLREAIVHNETGRLVDFFDHGALVNQIIELLDDPESCRQLGAAARAFARETYDLKSVCLPRQVEWINALAVG